MSAMGGATHGGVSKWRSSSYMKVGKYASNWCFRNGWKNIPFQKRKHKIVVEGAKFYLEENNILEKSFLKCLFTEKTNQEQ